MGISVIIKLGQKGENESTGRVNRNFKPPSKKYKVDDI